MNENALPKADDALDAAALISDFRRAQREARRVTLTEAEKAKKKAERENKRKKLEQETLLQAFAWCASAGRMDHVQSLLHSEELLSLKQEAILRGVESSVRSNHADILSMLIEAAKAEGLEWIPPYMQHPVVLVSSKWLVSLAILNDAPDVLLVLFDEGAKVMTAHIELLMAGEKRLNHAGRMAELILAHLSPAEMYKTGYLIQKAKSAPESKVAQLVLDYKEHNPRLNLIQRWAGKNYPLEPVMGG